MIRRTSFDPDRPDIWTTPFIMGIVILAVLAFLAAILAGCGEPGAWQRDACGQRSGYVRSVLSVWPGETLPGNIGPDTVVPINTPSVAVWTDYNASDGICRPAGIRLYYAEDGNTVPDEMRRLPDALANEAGTGLDPTLWYEWAINNPDRANALGVCLLSRNPAVRCILAID